MKRDEIKTMLRESARLTKESEMIVDHAVKEWKEKQRQILRMM